jgi:hypothetical protein
MSCALAKIIIAALSQDPACAASLGLAEAPMIEQRHTGQWCHFRPNGEIFCDGDEPKTFLEPQ